MNRQGVGELALARIGALVQGKYRIERLLGVGGMAAVYAAVHRNGHRVAIKFLHEHLAGDPDMRHLFSREAYVANEVEHTGEIPVLDDDVDAEGCAFLIMPLLRRISRCSMAISNEPATRSTIGSELRSVPRMPSTDGLPASVRLDLEYELSPTEQVKTLTQRYVDRSAAWSPSRFLDFRVTTAPSAARGERMRRGVPHSSTARSVPSRASA